MLAQQPIVVLALSFVLVLQLVVLLLQVLVLVLRSRHHGKEKGGKKGLDWWVTLIQNTLCSLAYKDKRGLKEELMCFVFCVCFLVIFSSFISRQMRSRSQVDVRDNGGVLPSASGAASAKS